MEDQDQAERKVKELCAKRDQLLQQRKEVELDSSLTTEEKSASLYKIRNRLNKVNRKINPKTRERDLQKNKIDSQMYRDRRKNRRDDTNNSDCGNITAKRKRSSEEGLDNKTTTEKIDDV
eukprot:scaffold37050_cov199-Amphora_coffeaeformis.AAC.5